VPAGVSREGLRERDHFEDLGADGRTKLKQILAYRLIQNGVWGVKHTECAIHAVPVTFKCHWAQEADAQSSRFDIRRYLVFSRCVL
jgi:hypothetical protein